MLLHLEEELRMKPLWLCEKIFLFMNLTQHLLIVPALVFLLVINEGKGGWLLLVGDLSVS